MPENPVPVVDIGFAYGRAACTDTRVVDHHGRWAGEPVLCGLGELDDIVEPRHVAVQGQSLTPRSNDGVGRSARGGFVDVAADDPAAATGELRGERRADTTARPGDDRRGLAAALVGRTED